jgi:Ser/Thr protein kinase RdoA (MazF antagonist)
MSIFNSLPPKINQIHLIKWLRENYSFLRKKSLSLKLLNSERDKNFLIIIDSKKKYVLKISNSEESRNLLDLQDYVLCELKKRASLKNYIPKKIHSSIKIYSDLINRKCCVRILTYIDGRMYASVKSNLFLEKSLGSLLGNLSKELQSLIKPSAFRIFEWDPSKISWISKEIKLFK